MVCTNFVETMCTLSHSAYIMTSENRPALELIELNLSQILSTFGQVVLMYVNLYFNFVRQFARIAFECHFEFLLYRDDLPESLL